jgi:hypothetical protein
MNQYLSTLSAQSLVLSALAVCFAYGVLSEATERWYWRAYFWSVILVDIVFGALGPWGHIFGVICVLLAPAMYFGPMARRQYVLRDMLLYVLLLAAMCTQLASAVSRQR